MVMDLIFSFSTAPSGCFVSSDTAADPYTKQAAAVSLTTESIFNPALLEAARGCDKELPDCAKTYALVAGIEHKGLVITDTHLENYGRVVRQIADGLQRSPAECCLAPLRGARLPALFVQTMTASRVHFDHFDYRQGADRVKMKEARLRRDVMEIVARRNRGGRTFRIAVIDVVKGGYGIPALVELLEDIKNSDRNYLMQEWTLDLQLLHWLDLNQNLRELWGRSRLPNFIVVPTFWRVTHAIIEDFDDALGFSVEGDFGIGYLKPCSIGGQFLYKFGNQVSVFESNDLFLSVQRFVAEAVTADLSYDGSVKQIYDIWGKSWVDYSDKG